MRVAVALACLLLPCAGNAAAQATPPATVTVYRCTDGAGKVSLQDAPCAKGQAQQAREMQRPVDAPATAAAPASPAPRAPAGPPAPRTVYLAPPRPLYECVTPDGTRYTSDDGRGNPRWVPLWTLGYPVPVQRGTRPPLAITGGTVEIDDGGVTLRRPGIGPRWMAGAGTWIRDTCQLLPQAEACDVLRDERDEIRRRFFNAMPSERDVLRVRERGVNARLDADCGGH